MFRLFEICNQMLYNNNKPVTDHVQMFDTVYVESRKSFCFEYTIFEFLMQFFELINKNNIGTNVQEYISEVLTGT